MTLDREARDKARKKTDIQYEAIDSVLANQKDEPVHSYSDGVKTLHRSGVVVRNDKNVGVEAMQRAKELLNSSSGPTLSRPKTLAGANDDWFRDNKQSVEQLIEQRVCVITKRSGGQEIQPAPPMPVVMESLAPDVVSDDDFYNYRPVIDDDEPDYIPKSER